MSTTQEPLSSKASRRRASDNRRSARQRLSGARSAMRADKVILRYRPEVACPSLVAGLHRLPLVHQRYGRLHLTPVMGREPTRSASLRVLVLPPAAGLGGLCFRRSLEQGAVVRGDERVGRRHGVSVVNGSVLAREGDPARVLAQPVLELGSDLA